MYIRIDFFEVHFNFFLSYRYLGDAFVFPAHPISALLARDVLPLADSNHFYSPCICYQENVLNMMFCTQKIKHMEGECVTSITESTEAFTHYCFQICHSETTWSKCNFLWGKSLRRMIYIFKELTILFLVNKLKSSDTKKWFMF